MKSMRILLATLTIGSGLVAQPSVLQAQGAPLRPSPPTAGEAERTVTRSISIPAKGLFAGEQLSRAARDRLTDVVLEARGLDIEVALVVPTGPWQIDGGGDAERRLTPARLAAVRDFLAQRGIDPKRIYVESRIDARLGEPQLVIELVGRPGRD